MTMMTTMRIMLIWSASGSCVWKCKWQKKDPGNRARARNVHKNTVQLNSIQ